MKIKLGEKTIVFLCVLITLIVLLNLVMLNSHNSPIKVVPTGQVLNSSLGTISLKIETSADTIPPIITLISPEDNYESDTGAINFTYNVTDVNAIDNCSLIINGSVLMIAVNVTKNIEQNFSMSLIEGQYNWSVNCTDANDNIGNSSTRNLSVEEVVCVDDDNDGVCDDVDKCLDSIIPESIPTNYLRPNHYAQMDEDIIFEVNVKSAKNIVIVDSDYNSTDTFGCTCEQILYCKPGENKGEYKFGCSNGTMSIWTNQGGWAPDCQINNTVTEGAARSFWEDTDGDFLIDILDSDDDNDGISDENDSMSDDSDSEGDPDYGIPDWYPKSIHYSGGVVVEEEKPGKRSGGSSGGRGISYNILESDTKSKMHINLAVKNQRIRLYSPKYGEHHLTIIARTLNTVTIQITSEPIVDTLKIGEEKAYDLNGDGVLDVAIKFEGFIGDLAQLSFRDIEEYLIEQEEPVVEVPEKVREITPIFLAIVALVLIIIVLLLSIKSKKRK